MNVNSESKSDAKHSTNNPVIDHILTFSMLDKENIVPEISNRVRFPIHPHVHSAVQSQASLVEMGSRFFFFG